MPNRPGSGPQQLRQAASPEAPPRAAEPAAATTTEEAPGGSPAADASAGTTSATTTGPRSFWNRLTETLGFERSAAAPAHAAEDGAEPVTEGADGVAPAAKAGEQGAAATTDATTTRPAAGPSTLQQFRQGANPSARANGDTAPQARGGQPATAEPGQQSPVGAGSAATTVLPAAAAGAASGAVAGKVGEQLSTSRPPASPARRTRKARLRLSRLDPWSVMKTAFLFSIAAGIVLVVAVYAVWVVLSTSGLFSSINDIVAAVLSSPGDTTPFRVEDYLSTQRVTGAAAVIAVFDVILATVLATLASFLYNLAASMLGGLEVTLAED